MVESYPVTAAVHSLSEQSHPIAVAGREDRDPKATQSRQDTFLVTPAVEDISEEIQPLSQTREDDKSDIHDNESAIKTYNHQDFENLIREDQKDEVKIYHLDEETPATHVHPDLDESAIHEVSHEDFVKLADESAIHEVSHQDFVKLADESAIHEVSHHDFDELMREETQSNSNSNSNSNGNSNNDNSNINDNSTAQSAFQKLGHDDFDNLVKNEVLHQSNTFENHKSPREEILSYHTNDGFVSSFNGDPPVMQKLTAVPNEPEVAAEDASTETPTSVSEDSVTGTPNSLSEDASTETPTSVSENSATGTPNSLSEDAATETPTSVSEESGDFTLTDTLPPTEDPKTAIYASSLPEDPVAGIRGVASPPPKVDRATAQTGKFLRDPNLTTHEIATHASFFAVTVSLAILVAAFLGLQMARKRRETRQAREIYSYVRDFDIEDIDVRKAITGGWHGQYKGELAKGLDGDSDFDTFSDDDDNDNDDDDDDDHAYEHDPLGVSENSHTIIFMEQGDLGTDLLSPIMERKRPVTMNLADRNVYLEESTNGADSDDDDIFAPVRTRPFD